MGAWSLLFVPASLALVVLLLACVSWAEQRVLSPRSLIVYSARSRGASADHVEAFVAAQAQPLLEGLPRGAVVVRRPSVAAPDR
ncbi:MAG: hypothetical protein M3179_14405 [Actinomycetota bacterium]|nr:hypothetical protein [Actinomycetota bacterium]